MKEQIKSFEGKMGKRIDSLKTELSSIRAGRANPSVLDKVNVDYYGTATPIQQVAAVSVQEGKILVIQPWDKSLIRAIEKAIQASEIGINPTNDGSVLRLQFPPLTEERRREISKQAHKYGEEAKVSVRNVRRDANEKLKQLKKAAEITEDDQKNGEDQIQKLTDKYCKEIDTIIAAKEKEIMEL
ncbi:MAG: ribosome recycling factor [Provencibacterium sp.]|jgi:ribosome recycling factor|nr:ribosome recycling factor [Provencibacterium sp.]